MSYPESENISIRFSPKYNSEGRIRGYETRTKSMDTIEVDFVTGNSGKYFFRTWVEGRGLDYVHLRESITDEKEAQRFAETKLRELIQEQTEY